MSDCIELHRKGETNNASASCSSSCALTDMREKGLQSRARTREREREGERESRSWRSNVASRETIQKSLIIAALTRKNTSKVPSD